MSSINKTRTDAASDIIEVDVTSNDAIVSDEGVRAVYSDVGGKIKIAIRPTPSSVVDKDVIITLTEGGYLPIGGVVKVYRYLTGTTAATMKIVNTSNVEVVGVKLLK